PQWRRAYDEIVQFERNLALEGLIIIKFWLHISPAEQLRRFEKRRDDPLRRWKLTDEDWRNRDKIDLYDAAVDEMFSQTDHELAPWTLVSGEQKRWARIRVLETVVERLERGIDEFEHPDWGEDGYA
ncbi:MAG: UDP-galactose-lipid carrier transferase, partial [Ilumatobacter sp.]